MKTIACFLLMCLAASAQEQTPKHNVYFGWNSKDLTPSTARILESVYAQLPKGKKVRFGIQGPVSNAIGIPERNMITTGRATAIAQRLSELGVTEEQIELVDISPKASVTVLELEVVVIKTMPQPQFTALSDYLPLPVQHFSIDPRKDNTIIGEQGTVITFPARTLVAANGSVPIQMDIELTEVLGVGSVVNADLHTMSGGRMLETGGSVLLEARCGGRSAKVADGREFTLEFARNNNPNGMETFVGRTDGKGRFDWVPEAQSTTSYREEFYLNGKQISRKEYEERMAHWTELKREQRAQEAVASNDQSTDAYLLKSGELGWINCDRFTEDTETTEFTVVVDTALHPSVRMVFDNLNSVLAGSYDGRTGRVKFSGVPVGSSVRIVACSIKADTPHVAVEPVTIRSNAQLRVNLHPTTRLGLEQELAALN